MITRGQNFTPMPLNICGSSSFGRYPKISIEKTTNMFLSDDWLVPYAGYKIAINQSMLGMFGRGLHTSTKFNRLVGVVDNSVYLINLFFDQNNQMTFDTQVILIGNLLSSSGVVWIAENNKPQILISDNQNLYLYDPTLSPVFRTITGLSFVPGFIDFHDTYFLCAARQDNFYSPPATNTWRLSGQNDGLTWNDDAASIGLLQTEPDNIQAVIRVPAKGEMILVIGSIVSEPWYDVGNALFPYQRSSSYSIDYGTLNPATIASNDEMVVWLAQNTKSGPIIMYTTGGEPEKITTDGIDYFFSQLTKPSDSQGFLYRQDGHLIYHINFYTDNVSLFYDFNTKKFFHATDGDGNYFIANEVAFFNNQYYFLSNKNGNLYAFDTIFTTYQTTDALGNIIIQEIPRSRICKSIRDQTQQAFIVNDIGFTIEQGTTDYQIEDQGPIYLITQDERFLITQGMPLFAETQDDLLLLYQNGNNIVYQQIDPNDFDFLIAEQDYYAYFTPRIDLSVSTDGGYSFSSDVPYIMNPIGKGANKLMWWQGGWANDYVCQFKFWGLGRSVCFDGFVNIRR